MKNQQVVVLSVTVAAAVVAAVVALMVTSGGGPLTGENFHDPKYKISMDLPVGWKQVTPPSDLKQAYAGRDEELVGYFQGPEGGSLNVLVFNSDLKLNAIRTGLQKHEAQAKKQVVSDEFPARINGIPAWINQYILREQVMPVYNVRVILDRGSTKVMVQYTLTPGSMKRQRKSVYASVQSISLD